MNDRPMYMISVAAELAGVHPQTLRTYESKGLVRPKRTPGGTRLYSEADVERLRVIQRLTTELGLNLARAGAHRAAAEPAARGDSEGAQALSPRSGALPPGTASGEKVIDTWTSTS